MKKIIAALGFLGVFAVSTAIASAGYFNTTPISRCDVSINRQLQVGSENNDVYTLQQFLGRAGYLQANPNGYFGPATKLAVKRFQADNYIPATGYVGATTINALNERLCDTDVRGDSLSYSQYGYSSGTTFVDAYDPYVQVISPAVTAPVIYANPQSNLTTSYNNASSVYLPSAPSTVYTPSTPVITPATTQIQSTNIIYSPYVGYTYGIVPQSGSLTISTPRANTVYNEGDTVSLAWTTSNLTVSMYTIVLENTSTGQQRVVKTASGNTASFVLTKELLDAVCAGACDNSQQGSFRIAITTPITDISGTTSTFRAAIAPLTIKRPYYGSAAVSISASKTPVNSSEMFKLYVNIPTGTYANQNVYGTYSFKIHALCPSSVQVSIAGVPCGQDFAVPVTGTNAQQEIPASITNSTYYRQDVMFEIAVTSHTGQVVGSARTTITVNATPFSW